MTKTLTDKEIMEDATAIRDLLNYYGYARIRDEFLQKLRPICNQAKLYPAEKKRADDAEAKLEEAEELIMGLKDRHTSVKPNRNQYFGDPESYESARQAYSLIKNIFTELEVKFKQIRDK